MRRLSLVFEDSATHGQRAAGEGGVVVARGEIRRGLLDQRLQFVFVHRVHVGAGPAKAKA
jgi:hypothetical protein